MKQIHRNWPKLKNLEIIILSEKLPFSNHFDKFIFG